MNDGTKRERIAIVCETPFQLLNYLNFFTMGEEYQKADKDLFILEENIEPSVVCAVKEKRIFNQVVTYKYTSYDDWGNQRPSKINGIISVVYKAWRMVLPKKYIKKICGNKNNEDEYYNYLFCSFPTPIAVAFTMQFPKIKIVLFDDGIGTYIGGISLPKSPKRDILYWLKGTESPWSKIRYLYVNNVDYCQNINSYIIKQIPAIRNAESAIVSQINDIFGYKPCELYNENKIIFFTQPLSKDEKHLCIDAVVIQVLETLGEGCVVRKHPRQSRYMAISIPIDESGGLWELICSRQIEESHVLIGCFSTAQFSPKFLYDKEPWVVVTYKLYDGLFDEKAAGRMDKMVQTLKDTYEDKQKIIVAASEEDLCEKMRMINDNIKSNAID